MAEDIGSLYWIGPAGQQYKNLGTALFLAQRGEFGKARSVTLRRIGYTNAVIARGGPGGWYVKEPGDKKPRPKSVTIKYGRAVK